MKHLKLVLPMLAFVLAIGLSFAFVSEDEALVTGYYGPSGSRLPIQVDCDSGINECEIQFVDENDQPIGSPLLVYPDQTSMTPLPSPSEVPYKVH
ncbi:DUF6520 family protein [Sinomicrobium weinanense]|uniref:Uncharacterized protein n=1 Tax=Sinomicrobium weinanense TaxID=2842200 RepID=A0A926JQ27_9FLAO|nr:DUF6520 family protein [Sinomicrobium weinanense]MBC9795375.1 hypothetical protein [Sinomicrobium weinanense]MBU3122910.1 hypothetical protein [Sinomicrobium weinanense]